MYFPQSAACMAPNSANHPTQADIMRVARSMGKMEGQVRRARQAFYCLFYRGDLNTNGWPLAKFGGVPSSTVTGCPAPASTCAALGATGDGVNLTGMTCWPSIAVTEPAPAPIAPNSPAAFPQPPAPRFPPLTTQAHSAAARALVASTRPTSTRPTTPIAPSTVPAAPVVAKATNPPIVPTTSQLAPVAQEQAWAQYMAQQGQGQGQQTQQTQQVAQQNNSAYQPFQYRAASSQIVNESGSLGTTLPGQTRGVLGVGDFDSCSFVAGLIGSVVFAAAGMYLFRQSQRPGGLLGQ
jgi:hypothetical protein